MRLPYSLYLALFISGPFEGRGLIERGLIYSSKKPAIKIISLNCNKLKIITQGIYHIYHFIVYIMGGGLIREGAYFIFSVKKGGLLQREVFEGGAK